MPLFENSRAEINKNVSGTHTIFTILERMKRMCTAVSYKTDNHYFGRTLDLEYSHGEKIVITPREYCFKFRRLDENRRHFAFIGTATVCENYPLYYDAVNEKGLCMAGLSFPDYTDYKEFDPNKNNVAAFELIPYLLCQCENVDHAMSVLKDINITSDSFKENLPTTPLHWIISDSDRSVTVECVKEGIKVYYNPLGVLTNNPPFFMQVFNLNDYLNLTSEEPESRFSKELDLYKYSKGMGAIGLPGDMSSQSRFVRASFNKLNSSCTGGGDEALSQVFHILGSVEQINGCVKANGKNTKTVYTSCCDAEKCIYYYTTYENRQISAVNMMNESLDKSELIEYNHRKEQQFFYHN